MKNNEVDRYLFETPESRDEFFKVHPELLEDGVLISYYSNTGGIVTTKWNSKVNAFENRESKIMYNNKCPESEALPTIGIAGRNLGYPENDKHFFERTVGTIHEGIK